MQQRQRSPQPWLPFWQAATKPDCPLVTLTASPLPADQPHKRRPCLSSCASLLPGCTPLWPPWVSPCWRSRNVTKRPWTYCVISWVRLMSTTVLKGTYWCLGVHRYGPLGYTCLLAGEAETSRRGCGHPTSWVCLCSTFLRKGCFPSMHSGVRLSSGNVPTDLGLTCSAS